VDAIIISRAKSSGGFLSTIGPTTNIPPGGNSNRSPLRGALPRILAAKIDVISHLNIQLTSNSIAPVVRLHPLCQSPVREKHFSGLGSLWTATTPNRYGDLHPRIS